MSGDEILSGVGVCLVADRGTALLVEPASCGAQMGARGTRLWRRDGSRWASGLDVSVAKPPPVGVISATAGALAVADD